MDIFLAINSSVALLNNLKEICKNIKNVEIKHAIADLSNDLADVKLAAADLKEQIVLLKEENLMLKSQKGREEKPEIKWGCYCFDGDHSRLYCTTCYDTNAQKILTSKTINGFRICNSCKGTCRSH